MWPALYLGITLGIVNSKTRLGKLTGTPEGGPDARMTSVTDFVAHFLQNGRSVTTFSCCCCKITPTALCQRLN